LPTGPARGEALRLLGTIRWYDDPRAAADLLNQSLREPGVDPMAMAATRRDLAWVVMLAGDTPTASSHARAALELLDGTESPALRADVLTAVGFTAAVAGEPEAIDTLQRAVELEERTEGLGLFRHPSLMYGIVLKWADRFEEARIRIEAMREQAVERGDEGSLPFILYHLSELECWAGNWAQAARLAQESIDVAGQTGQSPMRTAAMYTKALLEARMGHLDVAAAIAEEGLGLSELVGDRVRIMQHVAVLGFIELSRGSAGAAADRLRRAEELAFEMGIGHPGAIRYSGDEVEALVFAGKLEEAEASLARLEKNSTRVPGVWGEVVAGRCRALLLSALGQAHEAAERIGETVEVQARLPDPFEQARTLMASGTLHRRDKRKADARRHLEEALVVFQRLGAVIWAERVRSELARIGGRASELEGLTPTEQRVAELVAAGQTNREVADALFISIKTVEVNLTRIYRKLGVRSRSELTRRIMAGL
jgi:DNA-binding CsgD family transcriptional regulator